MGGEPQGRDFRYSQNSAPMNVSGAGAPIVTLTGVVAVESVSDAVVAVVATSSAYPRYDAPVED